MDISTLFYDLFFDYTLRTVALGAATLGIVSGALGAFAMLRRQSLLGDAMSHAALPGVVLAFMVTGLKTPAVLMLGAALAGLIGTLLMVGINRYTRIKEDSALGIILSVFFGFGLLLLTFLQRNPDARQAGLNHFLFGQAATLLVYDVIVMASFGGVALLLMLLFWKEFKLLTFDRDFGSSLGFPMVGLEILITVLLVIAIVVGLQAVGVVLMSAMVVAPAAAARQWTNRLGLMVALSALFGALAGVSGAVISSTGAGLSTGPVIVLCVSLIVAISLLFAPNRGLIWRWIMQQRNQQRLQTEQVLANLYRLASHHQDLRHPHAASALALMTTGTASVRNSLSALRERELVESHPDNQWALTSTGIKEAERIVAQWNGATP
ncbi:MAG TPA: iron chelate uptake ABC transporter family permease subunit [Caldilineaceae bacterium]|nr:iron chelate uptake ABC transporter family permease subunit [Caldilineaceae bacterium]